MAKIKIIDESGDKKYFAIIPYYILNHSTYTDQALYLNLKRKAGENGICYASEKTLCGEMKMGKQKFKKSLKYLLDHKWIEYVGLIDVQTKGGVQNIKAYKIVDIWRENINHYNQDNGVSKTTPLYQRGVQNNTQGVSKTTQRGAVLNNKEEPLKDNPIKGEGKLTPSQQMKLFLSDNKYILKIADHLFEQNGIPREIAIRELKKFKSYWGELNQSGIKQKWELQQTFQLQRRLNTWFKNISKFKKEKGKKIII